MAQTEGSEGWRRLRELCADVVELRRGDHQAERLRLDRERLKRERKKTEEEVIEQLGRWAQDQRVRDCICRNWISPAERKRRLREISGRVPDAAGGAAAAEPEANGGQHRAISGLPPEGADADDTRSGLVQNRELGPFQPDPTESDQIKPD